MKNLRLAFRNLSKTPFITAVAILSLALGIGANAAIYSLFDQALLAALPVEEPDRLVNLSAPGPKPGSQSCTQAGDCDAVLSYAMYRDLERGDLERTGNGFSGLAAHRSFGANLATGDETISGEGMMVSGSYFPVLGVRPALGRLLGPDDDRDIGQHDVVVLGHRFWKSRLGGDPRILDRTIVVNGRTLTVIGVAARGFEGTTLGNRPDVYVPLSMRAAIESYFPVEDFENRRVYWAYAFGRLAPGVSMESAASQLNVVYRNVIHEVEAPLQEGMSDATMKLFRAREILVEPGRRGQSSFHEQARTPLILLFAITGVVLLIACANIANLLLARGASRTQVMAVRNSLGAGRKRLMGQLLTESALLAGLGGLAGLIVAYWTLQAIGAILPSDTGEVLRLQVSPGVLLFAALLALGTGVLFGLYPALHATRPDIVSALKASSGKSSSTRSAARFRASLVTVQIALSMALLVSSGLFLKSLVNVSRIDLGIEEQNVVQFSVAPMLNGYDDPRSQAMFERMEEELATIPGVSNVTTALVALISGNSWGTNIEVEGFESGPDIDSNARFNKVGPGFFASMGMPLIAGRDFTVADTEGAPRVAIVNESFVEKFGLDPRSTVGKFMSNGNGEDELDTRIIGLVADAKYNEVKEEAPALFYTPYRQDFMFGYLNFYLRTERDPGDVMGEIQAVVHRMDPNLPVDDMKTLEQQVSENVFLDRMITTLSAAFAVLATLLAAVGLYGVLSYTVAQRTREIGVRMALGAGSGQVRTMVLGQMGKMLLIGGLIGVAGALAAGTAAESLLYGMEGHDPTVVILGTAVLAVIALAAAYVPAQRASQVDPMQALRYD